MIEYTVKRSGRKTISVYVRDNGSVEVHAPYRVSKAAIDGFVRQKEELIKKYIERQSANYSARTAFSPDFGSKFLFLGRECGIKHSDKPKLEDFCFYVPGHNIKEEIKALYVAAAKEIIPPRVEELSQVTGLHPERINITSAKTRWGSCSGKRHLSFSWRLIMASPTAVDYVIIHELCHITHMNHSREFWNMVERFDSDYLRHKAELKALSARLAKEDWQ